MTTGATVLTDSVFLPNRSSRVPLYFQIAARIEEAIRSGALPAGARLENEIALSERLDLSRPTVRRAIQELVDKGLVVRRRGIGTQVVHGDVTRQVELTSLHGDLERAGQKPSTQLLLREATNATPQVAAALGRRRAPRSCMFVASGAQMACRSPSSRATCRARS